MKSRFTYLFLVLGFVFMQAQKVSVRFEDTDNYKRMNDAYLVVAQVGQKDIMYKTDAGGNIMIPRLQGQARLYFYAPEHKAIQADFDITNDLNITAMLTPTVRTPLTNEKDVLMDAVIFDDQTGKAIANANILFEENDIKLTSNASGHFRLTKQDLHNYLMLKEGLDTLHFRIEKQGYVTYQKAYIFNTATQFDGIYLKPLQAKKTSSTIVKDALLMQQIKNSVIAERSSFSAGCTGFPTSIKVGLSCSCNSCSSVAVMTIQNYVEKGLNDEWIGSWEMESLKAGTLPYKTYGAYYVLHPINPNYDISNTTCKQVWDSDVSSNCVTAAQTTNGQFLVNASDNIARPEYSAENNGLNAPSGEGCGDGYSGTGSSWPCISDNVCAGHARYGHGRGMCQWGTQRWAQQFQTYDWITDHYYNPGRIYRCDANHPHPDLTAFDATLDAATIAPGHIVNATARIQNVSTGNSDRSRIAFYLSTDQNYDANDVLVGYLYINALDPYQSQNISRSITIPVTTTDGNYYILFFEDYQNTISETNENNNLQSVALTVDSNSAIDSHTLIEGITVYPNPTKETINIHLNSPMDIQSICLYNLLGQKIKEFDNNSRHLDISNMAAGNYVLKIVNTNHKEGVYKITKL